MLWGLDELPAWVKQRSTWVSLGFPPCNSSLPGWATQLMTLTTLDLSGCCALTELPESLGDLAAVICTVVTR